MNHAQITCESDLQSVAAEIRPENTLSSEFDASDCRASLSLDHDDSETHPAYGNLRIQKLDLESILRSPSQFRTAPLTKPTVVRCSGSARLLIATLLVCCITSGATYAQRPAEASRQAGQETLPGTELLQMEGDIASTMVDGVDRFLLRQIETSISARDKYWSRDTSSLDAYSESLRENRAVLMHRLGMRDERVSFSSPTVMATLKSDGVIAESPTFRVLAISWPTVGDMRARGLLLQPKSKPRACVVALPDADQSPELIVGLEPGLPGNHQWARRMAESGCVVVVPALVSRERSKRNGRANLTNREFIYRSAFELGRHVIGYELQSIAAAADWISEDADLTQLPLGVAGFGEGGMLALYAAASDERFQAALVSGYFGPRERVWEQPLDRNVFGLLERFGDAELAAMVFPRKLTVETARGPGLKLTGEGGGPAVLSGPAAELARAEFERAKSFVGELPFSDSCSLTSAASGGTAMGEAALSSFLNNMSIAIVKSGPGPEGTVDSGSIAERQQALLNDMDRHNQQLLAASPFVRQKFMARQKLDSLDEFEASNVTYRDHFANEVIGTFELPMLPARPRSRLVESNAKWTRYEVTLDVFPDVFAYGLLTIPTGIQSDERRPVVVCQHGLEGRPQSVVGELQFKAYKGFATQLAERGFITFAPQNIYIFQDRFRTLQRKANPLKKTLFSIMVPQHQQIVDWLQTLPNVDGDKIAFYGLSYGGKSAMRIPALVTDYCLSICSADFNEWVRKNASTRHNFSYVWTGEYEIFEFDLGSTFNYAEMASLIAPRPFMVERGHFDGVGKDEWVAYEFAKVRHLYAARLGIGDRCEIEWFVGPHTINGKGTFEFLHHHLNWPVPDSDVSGGR